MLKLYLNYSSSLNLSYGGKFISHRMIKTTWAYKHDNKTALLERYTWKYTFSTDSDSNIIVLIPAKD